MNREELAAYLTDTYSSDGEHLFAKYPSFLVFRHNGNRKWFAVIMDIPRKNLGLSGEEEISKETALSNWAMFTYGGERRTRI